MRAVLADPGDGEITAEYAKLVWEVHRDSHKASVYFERAVQASPENRYKFLHHDIHTFEEDFLCSRFERIASLLYA